jgi:hypothetical protein
VVLAAVTQDAIALVHASEALQKDRDVVLAAVTQDGLVLEYAYKGDMEKSKNKEVK